MNELTRREQIAIQVFAAMWSNEQFEDEAIDEMAALATHAAERLIAMLDR